MNGGVTLGHVLIGFAVVDVIAVLLIARGMKRDDADQRRAVRLVVIAALLVATVLCLVGLFLPDAQMRII